jgi:hypothetical protein
MPINEVIKFGGISEKSAVGVRSSERIRSQPNADLSQMERAQERAQIRDYGATSGTGLISKFNLASIPNEVLAARASKLGISLGTSPNQIDSSIASIKNLDLERTLIMLKRKESSLKEQDEGDSSFVINEATSLYEDLIESVPDVSHSLKGELSRGGRAKTLARKSKKKGMNTMLGCIWNGEGFRDPAKHSFVRETIKDYRLDFFAILETGRSDFSAPFLRHLAGGSDFSWYCLPPQGRSGGILLEINNAILKVIKVTNGDYYVKFQIRSKKDGFEWLLIPVYGAT